MFTRDTHTVPISRTTISRLEDPATSSRLFRSLFRFICVFSTPIRQPGSVWSECGKHISKGYVRDRTNSSWWRSTRANGWAFLFEFLFILEAKVYLRFRAVNSNGVWYDVHKRRILRGVVKFIIMNLLRLFDGDRWCIVEAASLLMNEIENVSRWIIWREISCCCYLVVWWLFWFRRNVRDLYRNLRCREIIDQFYSGIDWRFCSWFFKNYLLNQSCRRLRSMNFGKNGLVRIITLTLLMTRRWNQIYVVVSIYLFKAVLPEMTAVPESTELARDRWRNWPLQLHCITWLPYLARLNFWLFV